MGVGGVVIFLIRKLRIIPECSLMYGVISALMKPILELTTNIRCSLLGENEQIKYLHFVCVFADNLYTKQIFPSSASACVTTSCNPASHSS